MPSSKPKPDLLFVLSVDTEEEWDWNGPFPERAFRVSNAERIPAFQEFCDQLSIRPTYFVDHAVASDRAAASALSTVATGQRCEIGAHLHPWANPPFVGPNDEYHSHVVNLERKHIEAKLDALLGTIEGRIGARPNAFRTGRWGINATVLDLLRQRGIRIDSSMYPCFRNQWFDCEHTPLQPYWPDLENPTRSGAQRDILEFPVTVGFNHRNQRQALALYNAISSPALRRLRLVGAFWQSHLLRKLYLSPEVISGSEMMPLVDMAIDNGLPALHMFLHSSSLIDYGEGMLSTRNAFELICRNIEALLAYAGERATLSFCTISEAAALLQHRRPEIA